MNYAGKDAKASELPGIPSGIAGLDSITNGWKKSSLTIIAGAPSMGCTSLLLTCMCNAVMHSRRSTAFFSLQTRSDKLVTKWISLGIEVPFKKIEAGQLSQDEWGRLNAYVKLLDNDAGTLAKITDAPNPTIGSIVADCKRLREEGTELFLIDNINRIAISKKARAFCANREQELAYIVRRLKTLAYELDAPVIVVSQLSRSGVDRGRLGRPQLTDLRDSGAIENEADLVVLIYRHEYYRFTEDEYGDPTEGTAEIIVAKNAFGKAEMTKVQFISDYGLFKDLEVDNWSFDPYVTPTSEADFPPTGLAPNTIRLGSRMREEPPF